MIKSLPSATRLRAHSTTGLLVFLALVFMTGGGSREDIDSLAVLRFVSALAVAAAIIFIGRDEMAKIKVPLALLAAIALIAAVQLVPLPPEVWPVLPGRDSIARVDALVGIEVWRPISISPSATLNSLASLIVPLAALLLFAVVSETNRVLTFLVGIALVSALIGIVQLFIDPRNALFLYEITNNGSSVGLFANRNHHAVFLVCCILISLYLAQERETALYRWKRWAMAGSALFLTLAVITNGSRAGLICLTLVFIQSSIVAGFDYAKWRDRAGRGMRLRVTALILITPATLLITLFALAERIPALARILENNALEDLRVKLLPILGDMARDFQPLGTGLGAFEYAYRMREPDELLSPFYLSEAHNDWLQFPIEAGVLGLLVMVVMLGFAAWKIFKIIRVDEAPKQNIRATSLGLGLLSVLGVASVVDYPLRVPSIMVLASIALALFAFPTVRGKHPQAP